MSKHEIHTPLAAGGVFENPPSEGRGRSQFGCGPIMGEIGFIGLGRMGTAMAANLAAAGRPVIAYVRRAGQIGQLAAIGIRATTDIGDLPSRSATAASAEDCSGLKPPSGKKGT